MKQENITDRFYTENDIIYLLLNRKTMTLKNYNIFT